jgi:hypothetical protein
LHPASPWGASLVAGMKPALAQFETTLRLACTGDMLCAFDPICRTAVYVTRSYGGVGGGSREVFPYPEWAPSTR